MMKPEQRPCTDETREPENASPRRVPLNAMLGLTCSEHYVSTNAPKKKAPIFLAFNGPRCVDRNDLLWGGVRPASDHCTCPWADLFHYEQGERAMLLLTSASNEASTFRCSCSGLRV